MLYSKRFIFFLTLFLAQTASSDKYPVVSTKHGQIKGIFSTSRDGSRFSSFRGIPYAQPPTGPLRFQSPQPVTPWPGILNAQKDAPACVQKNYLFGKTKVEGSEDCLYLNVYAPDAKDELLPVMVFIHWGGFFAGYGSSDYLGPDYFMDLQNVILVTFNYRLGVFGFLSTFDDASPGNYGFKDQRAVLGWVRDNIEFFGGDKDQVTLFGQSAGGASVHFHMFNPVSQNLFHRGISESGTALALWAKPLGAAQRQIAQATATFVGCDDYLSSTEKMVNCLRNVSATKLLESGDYFKFFSIDPVCVYLPAIERKTARNQEPFLTKQPLEYIQNREFKNIPWILGTVKDEGILRAAGLLSQPETRRSLNKDFNQIMPSLMGLFMSTPKEKIHSVWIKIKDYYIGSEHNFIDINSTKSIQGLINLYTDRSFSYTTFQAALLHAKKSRGPVWLYNFEYKGNFSYGTHFAASSENIDYNWGVSHCDELLYLFKSPALFPDLNNWGDESMSRILVSLWTNFAKYGDPTPNSDYFGSKSEKWLKLDSMRRGYYSDKNLNFFNISGHYRDSDSIQLTMGSGFYQARYKFWENLPLAENIEELNQKHVEL